MNTCNLRKPMLAFSVASILLSASTAFADIQATIPLGGGWEAQVSDLSLVSINVDAVTAEFIAIEISKDFTEPSVNGIFPGISILFNQVADDANTVPTIVILDEVVTNLTGEDWTDYHMSLDSPGSVEFDVLASSGFSMTPFSTTVIGLTSLDAFGGVVANNSSFFPGAGPGELVMDISLLGGPVSFTLEQIPTPEPATLAMLAFGLVFARRSLRRATR